jgi:nucleoid-associated protein YgaU
MVAQAGGEPGSIPSPPRDEWPPQPRLESAIPAYGRPAGLRPGSVAAGPRRHTVAIGETFPSVARFYYGSERYAEALWRFNRGRFPRPERLTSGDLLVIPAVEELDSSASRLARSRDGTTPARAPASTANEAELDLPRASEAQADWADRTSNRARDEARRPAAGSHTRAAHPDRRPDSPVHVVRRYETLRSIARDRLGDARRAAEIIELNQDRLPETGQLATGQLLFLPLDARPVHRAP